MTELLLATRPATAGAQVVLDAPRERGLLLGGEWRAARSGARLATTDPATGRTLAWIGGMKHSGYGRDSGGAALDNYLEWKTVCAVL